MKSDSRHETERTPGIGPACKISLTRHTPNQGAAMSYRILDLHLNNLSAIPPGSIVASTSVQWSDYFRYALIVASEENQPGPYLMPLDGQDRFSLMRFGDNDLVFRLPHTDLQIEVEKLKSEASFSAKALGAVLIFSEGAFLSVGHADNPNRRDFVNMATWTIQKAPEKTYHPISSWELIALNSMSPGAPPQEVLRLPVKASNSA